MPGENGEVVEQSTILNEAEVTNIVTGQEEGEAPVVLPSDESSFEIPEKFKGKSAEEIAKAYVELERLKNKPEVQEQPPATKEPKDGGVDLSKYYDSYLTNDGLTEADYAELAANGMSRENVDEQIEFIKYKTEKAEQAILNGIPIEEFTKAAVKAREVWGEDKANEFNTIIADAPLHVQQLLVKNLVSEFGSKVPVQESGPIHTNTPQVQPSKGYATRSDLLKDMADPRYLTDKTFNKMVEAKLSVTDDSNW